MVIKKTRHESGLCANRMPPRSLNFDDSNVILFQANLNGVSHVKTKSSKVFAPYADHGVW